MKAAIVALCAAGMLAATGCRTGGAPKIDAMYDSFIKQPRTYVPLTLKAAPGQTITMSGIGEMTMESPLTPLSMRSADPSTAAAIVDALKTVAGIGMGAWALTEVANQGSTVLNVSNHQPPPVEAVEAVTNPARPRMGLFR